MSTPGSKVRPTVGEATCPLCGCAGTIKQNIKGHTYFFCPHPSEGGCYVAVTPRHEKSDRLLLAFVTKWRDTNWRNWFKPKASDDDEPAPANDDAPDDAPEGEKPSWWDKEI